MKIFALLMIYAVSGMAQIVTSTNTVALVGDTTCPAPGKIETYTKVTSCSSTGSAPKVQVYRNGTWQEEIDPAWTPPNVTNAIICYKEIKECVIRDNQVKSIRSDNPATLKLDMDAVKKEIDAMEKRAKSSTGYIVMDDSNTLNGDSSSYGVTTDKKLITDTLIIPDIKSTTEPNKIQVNDNWYIDLKDNTLWWKNADGKKRLVAEYTDNGIYKTEPAYTLPDVSTPPHSKNGITVYVDLDGHTVIRDNKTGKDLNTIDNKWFTVKLPEHDASIPIYKTGFPSFAISVSDGFDKYSLDLGYFDNEYKYTLEYRAGDIVVTRSREYKMEKK